MAIDPELFNERMSGTLSTLLGLRIVEATPDRVVAELTIRDELRTVGGAMVIACVQVMLLLKGLRQEWQYLAAGVIVLLVIILQARGSRT